MVCLPAVVILVLSVSTPSTSQLLTFESLLKTYKKTTLPLREDVYQNNLPILGEYDYVIVGASPSGCAIANRLTENPSVTVLLLEAGIEAPAFTDIPGTHIFVSDTEVNWDYYSEYNPRVCRGMKTKLCNWPSGKAIGGGTTWNAMMYTRGNARDYDRWAAAGNPGWSYNDVLPYFRKFENVKIPELRSSPYRGTSGPVNITYPQQSPPGVEAYVRALNELGVPTVDYNAPYVQAVSTIQSTIDKGTRINAATAYLKPIKDRKNLHIAQRALASKIIIDPLTKEAVGVEFIKKKVKRQVKARKEVILSAGGFGTPKLLMLSGIGPAEHLKSLGIPVIMNLRVGDHLQEHIGSISLPLIDKFSKMSPFEPNVLLKLPTLMAEYLSLRKGLLAGTGIEKMTYVRSKYAKGPEADIELFYLSLSYSTVSPFASRYHDISSESYQYWKPLEKVRTFNIAVMGCYPKSEGSIRLRSTDPLEPPVIDNNFLYDPEDLGVVVEGLQWAYRIANSSTMREAGVEIYSKPFPPCAKYSFASVPYFECLVQEITVQYHHQCCTARMGPDSDPDAVVDSRLRVRGIKKLRIADTSIFPSIPAGHTTAPAYMVGEKAADLIKEDDLLASTNPNENALLRYVQNRFRY